MTFHKATPYLMLYGRAEQALTFYREALGASTATLQRFGDLDPSCPEAQRNRVMHAELRIGAAQVMLSDGDGPGEAASTGGSVSIALELDDPAEARRAFELLASGGRVIQPLIDAPWGALFGVVCDPFGISWMFNCTVRPA